MLTRFAPSPTGYLHLGHALAAQEAFGFGDCLLRIEDIDSARCKPEFTQAIYQDLSWLGFSWPEPVRVQSAHMADYAAVTESLRERGLLYRCFKTRAELALHPAAPLSQDAENKRLTKGEAFAWRLSIDACRNLLGDAALPYDDTGEIQQVDLNALEDIIIARKDIGTSYHIAVTHDDALQNITHIVRGADFIDQTPYHVLIQTLMDWPTPAYHHHALLLGEDGEKLAKRKADMAIRSLRARGLSPGAVLDMARAGASG